MDGEFVGLEIKASGIHGTGCFAASAIPAGTVIVEYTGEVIGRDEAMRREDPGALDHSCYIFGVDDEVFIDANVNGNGARFINHSCLPNCRIERKGGRPYVVSLRDIAPGEELSYDYDLPPIFRMTCLCGSDVCKGYV